MRAATSTLPGIVSLNLLFIYTEQCDYRLSTVWWLQLAKRCRNKDTQLNALAFLALLSWTPLPFGMPHVSKFPLTRRGGRSCLVTGLPSPCRVYTSLPDINSRPNQCLNIYTVPAVAKLLCWSMPVYCSKHHQDTHLQFTRSIQTLHFFLSPSLPTLIFRFAKSLHGHAGSLNVKPCVLICTVPYQPLVSWPVSSLRHGAKS